MGAAKSGRPTALSPNAPWFLKPCPRRSPAVGRLACRSLRAPLAPNQETLYRIAGVYSSRYIRRFDDPEHDPEGSAS